MLKCVYKYNAQHQLKAVKDANGVTLFQYDALGRRVGKQHKDAHGTLTNTTYYWQGDNLLQENKRVDGPEKIEEQTEQLYIFEPNSPERGGNSHKPLALIKDNATYRYHLDHLGTPEALSDQQGNVVWYTALTSYGNLAIDYADKIAEQNKVDIQQPLRFQGQYADSETGLHYNRHRYYDPKTASFLTQDPIKLLGGVNNYQYVPNPILWVDPLGLSCKEGKSLTSNLNQESLYHGVGTDTMVAGPNGYGNSVGGLYDKVYDPQGNQLPGVDNDTAQAFDEGYLQAKRTQNMRGEGYRMAVKDGIMGYGLGHGAGLALSGAGSKLAKASPKVFAGQGSTVKMDGHKIYSTGYPPVSSNPKVQYRFSDPSHRVTGGDVYFGENVGTSYMEVRKNIKGKSLFVGDVKVDNVLDLTDPQVAKKMNVDTKKLTAKVNNSRQQATTYGYANKVSNQAYDEGYSGILYPSSRKTGNNKAVVLFDGRYDPNEIKSIMDIPIK